MSGDHYTFSKALSVCLAICISLTGHDIFPKSFKRLITCVSVNVVGYGFSQSTQETFHELAKLAMVLSQSPEKHATCISLVGYEILHKALRQTGHM